MRSVSYTHLDVYKRQVRDRDGAQPPRHAGADAGGAYPRLRLHRRGCGPVSYTHLTEQQMDQQTETEYLLDAENIPDED